jgi:RNA polymerase sigma factor (sigma-70 family)
MCGLAERGKRGPKLRRLIAYTTDGNNLAREVRRYLESLKKGPIVRSLDDQESLPARSEPDSAHSQLAELLSEADGVLTEQEKIVCRRRLIDRVKGTEVAIELGLTPGRVSQILKKAVEKLKKFRISR